MTLFIVSTISSLVFANYLQGQRQIELRQAAVGIADAIEHAQSLALSASSVGGVTPAAFGFFLTTTSTSPVVFADDGDNIYQPGEGVSVPVSTFPTGVTLTIQRERCGPGAVQELSVGDATVLFTPPLPVTNIVALNPAESCERVCILPEVAGERWWVRVVRSGTTEYGKYTGGPLCPEI